MRSTVRAGRREWFGGEGGSHEVGGGTGIWFPARARVRRIRCALLVLAQQGFQQGGAGPLHGRAGRLLQRFQFERSDLAPGRGDYVQEASDFESNLVLDRAHRFLPAAGPSPPPNVPDIGKTVAGFSGRPPRHGFRSTYSVF